MGSVQDSSTFAEAQAAPLNLLSLPADVLYQIYSPLQLKHYARIELASKSTWQSQVVSKYYRSICIQAGRRRNVKTEKYVAQLPCVAQIRLDNARLDSKLWERSMPQLLSNLEALELRNVCVVGSWLDVLRNRGAAGSLKTISVNYGEIHEAPLKALARANDFTSLQVLRLNPRFPFWYSSIATVTSTFSHLKELSIPLESLQSCGSLRNLKLLNRLSVSCRCNSPTFSLFLIPDSSERKRDWNATVNLSVERMVKYLPQNVKPWNFFLRLGHYEYNLLTRAVWLRQLPFVKALLHEHSHWNLDAACSLSGRTALLWVFLAEIRFLNRNFMEYAKLLLDHGADTMVGDRKTGLSAFGFSLIASNFDIFDLILRKATERDPSAPYYIAAAPQNGFTVVS
eukprot:TRINITY_DN5194_c0_g1_i2.p1 TRINITY_DN5194_c0_g1~~TRINITY_DN5194_c0_g1_i2.p1  ORF type:complete len:398 (-),score=27.62 TRINITY_DN5194_c0_g1_i2:291-1484(-)